MESSSDDAPESWEVADLEASVKRIMLSSSSKIHTSAASKIDTSAASKIDTSAASKIDTSAASEIDTSASSREISDSSAGGDVSGSVDQFLIEAIQNPRERVSVLRIEQDVEKFIRDPTIQQMEFKDLPTSYLRLAAHRVAQYYLLQSMVLLDNNLSDGSSSKIIILKTADSRVPSIRLVDIPVNLPSESKSVTKVAIKQRPRKNSTNAGSANSHGNKANSAKSVEERKEEYNRARARIFSFNNFNGGAGGRLESEPRALDNYQKNSLGRARFDEKNHLDGPEVNVSTVLGDSSSSSSSRIAASRIEKEPDGMSRTNHRAILRDRDVERSDPDYDRRYDRYVQRFDPGFGFTGGQYAVQPMYAPAVNYNTEFPQLGPAPRLSISAEHQRHAFSQHLPGSWVSPSTPTGMGYGHPDAMMAAYSTNHVVGRPSSALYMHSTQYHSHHPGMPIYPHDQIQSFTQAHRQQHDASFGFARPR